MEIYLAIVDTLILIAVAVETYLTWKCLQVRTKTRIKRQVSLLLSRCRIVNV